MTKSSLAMGINSCFLKVTAWNSMRDDKTYNFFLKKHIKIDHEGHKLHSAQNCTWFHIKIGFEESLLRDIQRRCEMSHKKFYVYICYCYC